MRNERRVGETTANVGACYVMLCSAEILILNENSNTNVNWNQSARIANHSNRFIRRVKIIDEPVCCLRDNVCHLIAPY